MRMPEPGNWWRIMLCGLPIARGEALMDMFDALAGSDLRSLDPSEGVLVITTYWRPVCPNPGMQGYSLVHPQSAHFTTIPADAVYAFLQDDERLYCIEDTPQRAFWTYWGDPAFDTPPFGTLCFEDLELQGNDTLVVSGLSDTRMEVLLDLWHPLKLSTPKMQLDPFPRLEKPGRKRPKGKRRRIR